MSLSRSSAKAALPKLIITLYQWHDKNQDITVFVYQETKNLPKKARNNIFDSELRILNLFEERKTKATFFNHSAIFNLLLNLNLQ